MVAPLGGMNALNGGLYGSSGLGGSNGAAGAGGLGGTGAMAGSLRQMRAMSAEAAGVGALGGSGGSGVAGVGGVAGADPGSFASALHDALGKVSNDQTHAVNQAHAFEVGNTNASLSDVMIDMQKANIQFQEAVQVRNKLVAAYNEIMQMQV